MADKEVFHFPPLPKVIPTPEELFHGDQFDGQSGVLDGFPVRKRKPIPHYKLGKHFVSGFVILLIVLVLVMMNLDKVGIHFYYMMSNSMESVIPKGSLIVGDEVQADKLKVGDIITYINKDGLSITHQIVDIEPSYNNGGPAFWTKGTDNVDRDEYIVPYANVKGKVIFHVPFIGSFFMKVKQIVG